MKKFVLIVLSISMLLVAGCSNGQSGSSSQQSQNSSQPQSSQAQETQIPENPELYQYTDLKEGETIATIHTTLGDIKVRFFEEQAPKAVANFLGLAEQGYYDNNKIHRIVKNFIIKHHLLQFVNKNF